MFSKCNKIVIINNNKSSLRVTWYDHYMYDHFYFWFILLYAGLECFIVELLPLLPVWVQLWDISLVFLPINELLPTLNVSYHQFAHSDIGLYQINTITTHIFKIPLQVFFFFPPLQPCSFSSRIRYFFALTGHVNCLWVGRESQQTQIKTDLVGQTVKQTHALTLLNDDCVCVCVCANRLDLLTAQISPHPSGRASCRWGRTSRPEPSASAASSSCWCRVHGRSASAAPIQNRSTAARCWSPARTWIRSGARWRPRWRAAWR